MIEIDWNKESGWLAPKIVPHGPITIETSASSLHYGISCHESLSVVKNKETGKL
jgi:branched-chain amino acid aminotransferase